MWLLALVQYVWGYLTLLNVMLIFKGMEFKKYVVAPTWKTFSYLEFSWENSNLFQTRKNECLY